VENTVAHETNERVRISPLAGKPAPKAMLVDLVRLEQAYYDALVSEAQELVNTAIGGRT
jgi:hypothetical protein